MLKIETVEETVYLEVNALEGYARKEYVDDAIDGVNSSISNIESDVSTINSELEKKANKSDLEGLATERYVDDKIDNIPEVDLTPYATVESVDEKLKLKADASDLDSLATKKELEEKADISYVDDKIAGIKIPSIEGLATEEYVDNKVSSIDLSEYALTNDLSSAIGSINNDLGLKADKTELEGLATEYYVNEKIDEKEVGITEPELINKSVGSDRWMREGAYGVGRPLVKYSVDPDNEWGGFNHIHMASLHNNAIEGTLRYGALVSFNQPTSSHRSQLQFQQNRAWIRGAATGWGELHTEANTSIDRSGVLHIGTNQPIDTLNTSDMADTVVDNDLLTVTSGAVYRAITKLQNKVDELEGQVNELKALQ